MRLSRRLTAALVMSSFLLTSMTGISWVLCFGSDGHVTVEAAGSTCCRDGNVNNDGCEPAASFLTASRAMGVCGMCTDIPLFAAETIRLDSLKLQAKHATDVAMWALGEPAIYLTVTLAPKQSDHILRCDGTLAHLRTVVLRC